jgi:hypothetical protein
LRLAENCGCHAFGRDVPHDRILDAAETVKKLGLSEDAVTKKGGGLLWLLVVAAAVALPSKAALMAREL